MFQTGFYQHRLLRKISYRWQTVDH